MPKKPALVVSGSPREWLTPQPVLRTNDTVSLGVSRGELAGPRWRSPFRGTHVPVGSDPDDPMQRILEAAELLPADAAVGGWGAAYLLGATDLDGRGLTGRAREEVPLVLQPGMHLVKRSGIAFWRSELAAADVTVVRGIRVTVGARTAFDVARRSRTLELAVVAIDAMARQAGVSPAAVTAYAAARRRKRGLPLLRRALRLVDPLARSVGESRLRVLWVVDAGLPAPVCNPYVVTDDGFVVGLPDLLLVSCGLVGEYDGSQHRDLDAHTRDNIREEDFEGLGLVVVRATSLDLGVLRRQTVTRLQLAHRRAMALDPACRAWGWRPGRLPPMR